MVVEGSLETAVGSGSSAEVLLETSREVAGSGTGVFMMSPVGSPKGVGEGGCGVRCGV